MSLTTPTATVSEGMPRISAGGRSRPFDRSSTGPVARTTTSRVPAHFGIVRRCPLPASRKNRSRYEARPRRRSRPFHGYRVTPLEPADWIRLGTRSGLRLPLPHGLLLLARIRIAHSRVDRPALVDGAATERRVVGDNPPGREPSYRWTLVEVGRRSCLRAVTPHPRSGPRHVIRDPRGPAAVGDGPADSGLRWCALPWRRRGTFGGRCAVDGRRERQRVLRRTAPAADLVCHPSTDRPIRQALRFLGDRHRAG